MIALTSSKTSCFRGEVEVTGDKSISHRALILASQAIGKTEITGLLESDDVLNTARALRLFGVNIEKSGDIWIVDGVGVGGLSAPNDIVDMGNSGTGVRLLMGLIAPYEFPVVFTGDESLRKRPMKRIITPLSHMGAEFTTTENNRLPLTVCGVDMELMPIKYELPVASAQVKSAILLAALNVVGNTTIIEPEKTRDHTELMMKYQGVDITRDGDAITIVGQPELSAKPLHVPSDPSSAAFLAVAALITPDSHVVIKNVLINPLRIGLYETLREMGGNIEFDNISENAGEKIADISVKYSKLKGINVPAERAPSMIDEYPILSVAASVAEGKTTMNGLKELRVKESDRLSAIADGLIACGVKCDETDDSLTIYSSESSPDGGCVIKTRMDHRLAMSFVVMGMISKNPVTIDDSEMIDTSFPNFVKLMNGCGANVNSN